MVVKMTYRISVIIAICKQQVIWHASGVDQQTLQEVHILMCTSQHTLLKKRVHTTTNIAHHLLYFTKSVWKKIYSILNNSPIITYLNFYIGQHFFEFCIILILRQRICKMVRLLQNVRQYEWLIFAPKFVYLTSHWCIIIRWCDGGIILSKS